MDYSLSIPQLIIASQTKTIHLPRVVLEGKADLGSNGKSFPQATFKLESPNTGLQLGPAGVTITDVSMSGQAKN